ncbi:BRO-N domain-containing protein [Gloeothece verrucosa]|uniref:Prophage antirepressor n=1 Tax=Gloeothece verrucosa (strain PCC 7822) TaxID=497965 RepID=E0ULX5_GLOV7|nr:BRO family protein [Gloeothece verrucosa]ADN17955.1 prophage antirepressor [Gloeothece verrucosa PCC 7822]
MVADKSLSVFSYGNNQIRIVLIDGEPWFVAKDVCNVLEHSDVSMACQRLKSYEKGTSIVCTPGGNQEMAIISESGLYRLVLTSRKPQAEPFQDWVCQEVLPSIRQTGRYEVQPPQPKAQGELILMLAQEAVERDKRINALEAEHNETRHEMAMIKSQLADTTGRLDRQAAEWRIGFDMLQKTKQEAWDALDLLQSDWKNSKEIAQLTTRSRINLLVRSFCKLTGVSYKDVFTNFYLQLKYRYHYDVKARARNSRRTLIDQVEQDGQIENLYLIALQFFYGWMGKNQNG